MVLQEMRRPAEAADMYRRALRLAPGYRGALYNLGDLLKDEGDHGAAVAVLQETMGLPPRGKGLEVIAALALLELPPPSSPPPPPPSPSSSADGRESGGGPAAEGVDGLGQRGRAAEGGGGWAAAGGALGATSAALRALEAELTAAGELDLSAGGRARQPAHRERPPTLEGEVRRLQHEFADASNVLAVTIGEAGWWGGEPQRFVRRLRAHARALARGNAAGAAGAAGAAARKQPREVHLVVQYFAAASVSRQTEIDQCLLQNIRNEHIHT